MTEVKKEKIAELDSLAQEINAEHRAFVGSLKKTAEHGIRAGELLTRAKAQCPHGTWLPWLSENFEDSARTAQEYMRLYNHRDALRANTRDSAYLSVSGALKELATPKEKPSYLAEDISEAAEALRELADIDPTRLADAVAMLARTHAEKHTSTVLGFAWEKAFREYKLAVRTDEDSERVRTLRALDRYVRPIDLPPSRGRFAFEDELTYREMHTTFADLIDGGHVADHTAVAHHLRVMHNLHREGLTELAIKYVHALEQGTVRPVPEEEEED